MEKNLTLCIIKPDAAKSGNYGEIINIILNNNFLIVGLKMVKLSVEDAENFYEIHKNLPFFRDLVKFMSSSPIIVLALKKSDAVKDFRKLIGKTNPLEAENGTIRRLFGSSTQQNAVHGSDSDENAKKEIHFFFDKSEIFDF